MVGLTFLDAGQNGQEGPFEVLSKHVRYDRLSCLLVIASRWATSRIHGRLAVLAPHLLVLGENLDYQATALEEGEENEFERLLYVAHEQLQRLPFFLPLFRGRELLLKVILMLALLLQELCNFLRLLLHLDGDEGIEGLEDEAVDL